MKIEEEEKTFKKMLENYKEYNAKIKYYKKKLLEIQNKDITICGGIGDGQPKPTGYKECQQENMIINKVDDENLYKYLINITQSDIDLIDSIVDILKDYPRNIIKQKYYYKFELFKIADENCKTERAIIQTIKHSLKFMEKKYKELREV